MEIDVSCLGAPFWSWNDDLDPHEIRRQVREMARAGLGGHMMHARIGLVTPYLGEQWMNCIRAAVDESARAGLDAWLYDEDCWPSGAAGGRVPARGPAYWSKHLEAQLGEVAEPLATFAVRLSPDDTQRLLSARRLGSDRQLAADEQVWSVAVKARSGYVDLLDPAVVQAFIEEDYAVYEPVVGEHFGKTIPGVFTDEPQYSSAGPPWSNALPDDLIDCLPWVWFDGDEAARYRYWRTVSEQFVTAFSQQIGHWCGQRGLVWTGHFMGEDSLASQMRFTAGVMPHYEHFQMPGIDHLGRGLGSTVLCKQAVSVARQLGRRRVLTELFGCTGWNASFEDLRWLAEYQIALGLDFLCQHLSLYSLRGCRKRDYPPSLHVQQPWWTRYGLLNTAFGRLLQTLTDGEPLVDVLLLHPMETVWRLWRPDAPPRAEAYSQQFEQLSRHLLSLGRDFDYGDESLLASWGSLADGAFVVGDARYRVVVVPPRMALRDTTAELLAAFEAAGGTVVRLDERWAETLGDQLAACPARWSLRSAEAPQRLLGRHVRLEDGSEALFLANSDPAQTVKGTLVLPGRCRVTRISPETGAVTPVPSRFTVDTTELTLCWRPKRSHLLRIEQDPAAVAVSPPLARQPLGTLDGPWELRLHGPNALTLDSATATVDGADPTPAMPLHRCLEHVRAVAGARKGRLAYRFESALPDHTGCELALEQPGAVAVEVNGEVLDLSCSQPWMDVSLRRYAVGELLRSGANEIVLTHEVSPGLELESIYLLGAFAVGLEHVGSAPGRAHWYTPEPMLQPLRRGVLCHDLTCHGLPFYAGTLDLTADLELPDGNPDRWLVLDPPPDAIIAAVLVNGVEVGVRAWSPWEYHLGDAVRPGGNRITLRLTNSLRNLLGPHHHIDGELGLVGPDSFVGRRGWTDRAGEGSTWRDDTCLVRLGLAAPPRLEQAGETRGDEHA